MIIMPKASWTDAARRARPSTWLLSLACVVVACLSGSMLRADPASEIKPEGRSAFAEPGREIFNGKGLCSTCHGVDGYRSRLPENLSRNVRENIARLNPAPADLRQAETLTLTTDKQRFEAIRHGHLRTAMYPLSQATLSDEEIFALLPYLASIRGTVPPPASEPSSRTLLSGDAKNGRQLYHELGGCAMCHGIEGHLDRRPPTSKDLSKRLDSLPAPPANLRDPATLKSQNDEDRYRSIKLGHPGTAMYPKTLLRDEDIRDLIAYLAGLRNASR